VRRTTPAPEFQYLQSVQLSLSLVEEPGASERSSFLKCRVIPNTMICFLKYKNSSGHKDLLSLSLCPKEGPGGRKPQGPHQFNLQEAIFHIVSLH